MTADDSCRAMKASGSASCACQSRWA